MQIVIDIDEDLYREIKQGIYYSNAWDMGYAIQKGVPLPKAHGRLKDIDIFINSLWKHGRVNKKYSDLELVHLLDNIPTVLEADNETIWNNKRY